MTLSAAFNNAMAGLRVAGKSSEIVAQNVSNATTLGYSRRQVDIAATSTSGLGGVTISGVTRVQDVSLLWARREAQADLGYSETILSFSTRTENVVGTPDDPAALTNLLADFDASLVQAASRPDASERLEASLNDAQRVIDVFRNASADIQRIRTEADEEIEAQVNRLNEALNEVHYLNEQIQQFSFIGREVSALVDLRQVAIDQIHDIAPVREAKRSDGRVALYSHGGAILLDDRPNPVSFTGTKLVTPYMSLGAGDLSGLSMNGFALDVSSGSHSLRGGTLAAQFAIRDELAPDAQAQLDAAARNLLDRFQDSAVDPTLAAGMAGLFTDEGLAFDPVNEVGLASRLELNAAVDPAQGGEPWRLRDGMAAVATGAVGQSSILNAMRDALADHRVPASGNFGTSAMSMENVGNALISRIGIQRLAAEQSQSFSAAAHFEMSQAELADGVDTDAELERLILIEQAYAANSRVLQTIDDMMELLMGL